MINIKFTQIIVGIFTCVLLTPFVTTVALLEVIQAIIYLMKYVVSMCGLAVLYTMQYTFPNLLSTSPFEDRRMIWSTYRYVAKRDFCECLRDIYNTSAFTN